MSRDEKTLIAAAEDDLLHYQESDGLWSYGDVKASSKLLIEDIKIAFPNGANYKYSGSSEKLNISIGRDVCGTSFEKAAQLSDTVSNLLKNIFNDQMLLMHVCAQDQVLECVLEV